MITVVKYRYHQMVHAQSIRGITKARELIENLTDEMRSLVESLPDRHGHDEVVTRQMILQMTREILDFKRVLEGFTSRLVEHFAFSDSVELALSSDNALKVMMELIALRFERNAYWDFTTAILFDDPKYDPQSESDDGSSDEDET